MSHFTRVQTVIRDRDTLVAALGEIGFSEVEVHNQAQPLCGYQGDRREQTAEVIVRRQFVGASSNDLGFKEGAQGSFDAIISEFDRHKYDDNWLAKLNRHYAYPGGEGAGDGTRTDHRGRTRVRQRRDRTGGVRALLRGVRSMSAGAMKFWREVAPGRFWVEHPLALNAKDGSVLLYIPGGEFEMGSAAGVSAGVSGYGTYNRSGNVWEWCADWSGEKYYGESAKVDPRAPAGGSKRVNRGGGWGAATNPGYFRAAFRNMHVPDDLSDLQGLRLVKTAS